MTLPKNFFDEFVTGSGPEFTVLLDNHPYTQEMMNDSKIQSLQDDIRNGNTEKKGRLTNYGVNRSPLDALSTTSMAKQFIGSYRYDGYSDSKYIYNVITDSKSRTSLFYHGGLRNPRRKESRTLGNTYQFYLWKSRK